VYSVLIGSRYDKVGSGGDSGYEWVKVLICPQHHNWITLGSVRCTAICVCRRELQEVAMRSHCNTVEC
jgi:hypothetical protein